MNLDDVIIKDFIFEVDGILAKRSEEEKRLIESLHQIFYELKDLNGLVEGEKTNMALSSYFHETYNSLYKH